MTFHIYVAGSRCVDLPSGVGEPLVSGVLSTPRLIQSVEAGTPSSVPRSGSEDRNARVSQAQLGAVAGDPNLDEGRGHSVGWSIRTAVPHPW